jgi:hypothetical protein
VVEVDGVEVRFIRASNNEIIGVEIGGQRFALAKRMGDTEVHNYEIDGSRYFRLPKVMAARVIGIRIQVSAKEFRGYGNFLCYQEAALTDLKSLHGFHYFNYVPDSIEHKKRRESR